MTSRKKPGVAFWATVVVVVLVLYVLSTGPAVFLYYKLGRPFWLDRIEARIYWPLLRVLDWLPDWVNAAYVAHLDWWSPWPTPAPA